MTDSGNPTVAASEGRAHKKSCYVLQLTLPLQVTTSPLEQILQQYARQPEGSPSHAPGHLLIDCASLIPKVPAPVLYSLWITPVSTPSLFSLTCVCEHLRNQLIENGKVIMSIFNDTGGYGEVGEALAAATYMVVLKRVDVEKLRCVPIIFSTLEMKIVQEYLLLRQSSFDTPQK